MRPRPNANITNIQIFYITKQLASIRIGYIGCIYESDLIGEDWCKWGLVVAVRQKYNRFSQAEAHRHSPTQTDNFINGMYAIRFDFVPVLLFATFTRTHPFPLIQIGLVWHKHNERATPPGLLFVYFIDAATYTLSTGCRSAAIHEHEARTKNQNTTLTHIHVLLA